MHFSRLVAPVVLAFLGVAPGIHADVLCNGRVSALLTEKEGNVMAYVTFRNDWLLVCNIRSVSDGVQPDVCKSWLATLTTLRVTQEPATFYYVTPNTSQAFCASIPSYANAPAPNYVSINLPDLQLSQ